MRPTMLAFGVAGAIAILVTGSPALARSCADQDAVRAAREEAATRCNCENAPNHGQYVKCVADVVKERAAAKSLPTECKGDVMSCAARSTCGKPNAVTCCRVDGRGHVRCSIKSNAAKCEAAASSRAIACVGSAASCCDACGADDGSPGGGFVCEGSTTTSTPPTTSSTHATTSSTAATTSTTAATTSSTAATTSSTATTTSTTEATTSSTQATTTSTSSTTTSTPPGSPGSAFIDVD